MGFKSNLWVGKEEGMVTHSSILAWKISWKGEPGGLQSKGSLRVRHNLVNEHSTGDSTQYSVMIYMGKESKREWIYVYVY